MTILTFDGTNVKSTHIADFLSGRDLEGNVNPAVVGGLTAVDAHNAVAWLFRGVAIRASLVSRMPFALMRGETEVTKDPAFESWLKGFRTLLYKPEAVKCLTGHAYWLLESNAAGYNGRPRWVLPQTMQAITDPVTKELQAFRRNGIQVIPLDKLVYFWNPNYKSETEHGPGEAQVVLGPASTLLAMDSMVAQFFNLGAVKVTVFSVPAEMQEADKTKFQDFLNRRLSGLRAAFRNIVMRGEIKPTVIGSDIKDTEAAELTQLKRDDIAVGLGLAPSVLDGTSANFATAQSDAFGTITNTIIPECEILFEAANDQLFSRLGVKLVVKPEELEIMQSAQLLQVMAVAEAVGKPVFTVNEGRELLGKKPLEGGDELEKPQPPPQFGQPAIPAPVDATSGAPAQPIPAEELSKALTAWRKAAIEAVKAGRPDASGATFAERIPLALWQTIDGELARADTAAAVRAVFEAHWPRPERSEMAELANEIRLAREALEA